MKNLSNKQKVDPKDYPDLKIYVLIYIFSTSKYQVQKTPPTDSNGIWQAQCVLEDLPGERFSIYAIITTQELKEGQLDTFPIYVNKSNPISVRREK